MPTANEDDRQLCARAARGDRAAFGLLVLRHEAALRAFLARVAGADLADDVAQDAFLKAWRGVGQYDGRARFSTWLTSIAWRCYLDQLRRAPRQPAERTEEFGGSTETDRQVSDVLGRLPAAERAALVLCDGHGWSHADAANMLRLPLGTLKSRVAKAKERCRAMWNGDGDEC